MKRVSLIVLALLITGLFLSKQIKADDLEPAAAMKALGPKGEKIFSAQEIAGYGENYGRMDSNHDGFLTIAEYIANSGHFRGNKAGAKGFINISDNDKDGAVSRAEYVMNRIITDEAKAIYTRIDPATDWNAVPAFQWRMKRAAFVGSDYFADKKMAHGRQRGRSAASARVFKNLRPLGARRSSQRASGWEQVVDIVEVKAPLTSGTGINDHDMRLNLYS